VNSVAKKSLARQKRKIRVRKKITGASGRPRLNVFKSSNHIYAQLIDDSTGNTLLAASTLEKDLRNSLKHKGNIEAAQKVGEKIAILALEKGIKEIVFDRNGFLYHGRIKALADSAREKGLSF
jgi:large subunit ribosomal protein L18